MISNSSSIRSSETYNGVKKMDEKIELVQCTPKLLRLDSFDSETATLWKEFIVEFQTNSVVSTDIICKLMEDGWDDSKEPLFKFGYDWAHSSMLVNLS